MILFWLVFISWFGIGWFGIELFGMGWFTIGCVGIGCFGIGWLGFGWFGISWVGIGSVHNIVFTSGVILVFRCTMVLKRGLDNRTKYFYVDNLALTCGWYYGLVVLVLKKQKT